MQRSYAIFQESIKSEHTRRVYSLYMAKFLEFARLKSFDDMVSLDHTAIQNMIIDYVIYLKRKHEHGDISPNAFQQRIAPIELFMVTNDVVINFKKIKKMYPRQVKKSGDLPYTLEDLQAIYRAAHGHRNRSLVSFFASTGARPEAIIGITVGDLKEKDGNCMHVKLYKNDPEEYDAFLTPEATADLRAYLKDREFHGEKITPASPMFRNKYRETMAWHNVKPISYKALRHAITDTVLSAGVRVDEDKRNGRYRKAVFGAFRKWFETTLNNNNAVNANVTEKLMGHLNDLRGTYYNPPEEVRFANFGLAIPDLTINDTDRKVLAERKKTQLTQEEMEARISSIVEEKAREVIDAKVETWLSQHSNTDMAETLRRMQSDRKTSRKAAPSKKRPKTKSRRQVSRNGNLSINPLRSSDT